MTRLIKIIKDIRSEKWYETKPRRAGTYSRIILIPFIKSSILNLTRCLNAGSCLNLLSVFIFH